MGEAINFNVDSCKVNARLFCLALARKRLCHDSYLRQLLLKLLHQILNVFHVRRDDMYIAQYGETHFAYCFRIISHS